jgi:cadmium resistance protein CadD (predicted permease)
VRRKIFIYGLRIFASLLMLFSFLLMIAEHLSDKGDIVDRNSGWILVVLLITLGIFIYAFFILGGAMKRVDRGKTADELRREISKRRLS